MAAALAAALLSSCGDEKPKEPPPTYGQEPGVESGAQALVSFLEEVKRDFAEDVSSIGADGWLGELARTGALEAHRELLLEKAETNRLDVLCVLSADGQTTLIRATNPMEEGGTELWDTTGQCEAGICVDMRALITRALTQDETITAFELYPEELMKLEALTEPRRDFLLSAQDGPDTDQPIGRTLADAAAVRRTNPRPGQAPMETRGLVLLDVRPMHAVDGEIEGVLVCAWLLSRNHRLLDAFHQQAFMDSSLFVETTRVATTTVLKDLTVPVGDQVPSDLYDEVVVSGEAYFSRVNFGYGLLDAKCTSIVDGTGRTIGFSMVEQAADPGAPPAAPPPEVGGEEE
ncbi:MAG: hypothetical protein GF320_00315 [Armatimonadia bacterium]|nr:hypothetical protein [Armatimonadia bacterium]